MDQTSHQDTTITYAPGVSLREQLERASPSARALLPIRFFFGLTFVYAGIDKLIDPAFFDAANPGSIVGQLQAFTHVSPLAPLIRIVEPMAVPMGLLIALGEIAIGLGALTGLAFRLAAFGGLVLSLTFWLTASWGTHPYYYGPDLPYAIGWLALLIGGHGNLLVPRAVRELGMERLDAWDAARLRRTGGGATPRGADAESEPSPERRLVLQVAVLAAATLALASTTVPLRLVGGSRGTSDTAAAGNGVGGNTPTDPATSPTATPTDPSPEESPEVKADDPTPGATTAATPFKPNGLTVASIAAVDAKGAVRIWVPRDAPAPLPAGDPGIVVKLANGKYACYDAVCTHEGCKVGWDARDGVMMCPCHGAVFDPNDHGAVLGGPTNTPLPELPIVIDHQAGTITLKA